MECSQIKKILFESADTEIPAHLRESVEAHLSGCRSCASRLEALKGQFDALRSMPRLQAPPDFLEKVRRRVEKPAPSVFERIRIILSDFFNAKYFFRFVATAATAVLVVVTAQLVLKDSELRHQAIVVPAPPSPAPASPAPSAPAEAPAARAMMEERQSSQSKSIGELAAPEVAGRVDEREFAVQMESLKQRETVMQRDLSTKKELAQKAFPPPPSPPPGSVSPRPAEQVQKAAVALTLRLPPASAPQMAARRPAMPDRSEKSVATRSGGGGFRMKSMEAPRFEEREEPAPPEPPSRSAAFQSLVSEVKRLVMLAKGKILSERPAVDAHSPGVLLTEIPSENYPPFIEQLRRLGPAEFKADESFAPRPDSSVQVTVTLKTSE